MTFPPSPPNNLLEQSEHEREVINSSDTEGHDVDISATKSDMREETSYLPGKNNMISLGINSLRPFGIFSFSIRDLVRQKWQRLLRILLWLRAHLLCWKVFQTDNDLVREITLCSTSSSVLANLGGLGFPPPMSFGDKDTSSEGIVGF